MCNKRRAPIWTAVSMGLALSIVLPSHAREVFDDFSDGEVFDCDPVCWSPPPPESCCPAETIEVLEEFGGVCMVGANPGNVTGFATAEVWSGDVSLVCEAPPLGATVGGSIHLAGGGFYWLRIFDLRVTLFRFDPLPDGGLDGQRLGQQDFALLSVDPGTEQFMFEMRTVRSRVEVLLWPAGRPKDASDLVLSVEDATYRSGVVGPTGHFGCVRSVRIRETSPEAFFRRGDANIDGAVDISDAILMLTTQFLGEGEIVCDDAADADDSEELDITDPIVVLGKLLLGNVEVPAPGIEICGPDPTVEDVRLGCESYTACER